MSYEIVFTHKGPMRNPEERGPRPRVEPADDSMLGKWEHWVSAAPDSHKGAPITYRGVARLIARLREAEAKRDSLAATGQDMIDHFRARAERAEAALNRARDLLDMRMGEVSDLAGDPLPSRRQADTRNGWNMALDDLRERING